MIRRKFTYWMLIDIGYLHKKQPPMLNNCWENEIYWQYLPKTSHKLIQQDNGEKKKMCQHKHFLFLLFLVQIIEDHSLEIIRITAIKVWKLIIVPIKIWRHAIHRLNYQWQVIIHFIRLMVSIEGFQRLSLRPV